MTDSTEEPGVATDGETDLLVTTDGRGTYRGYHDPDRRGLAETITLVLAEVEGTDPTAVIDEFGRYVEPDALDALFRSRPDGRSRGPGHVELRIAGYDVTVYSDGDIVVEE